MLKLYKHINHNEYLIREKHSWCLKISDLGIFVINTENINFRNYEITDDRIVFEQTWNIFLCGDIIIFRKVKLIYSSGNIGDEYDCTLSKKGLKINAYVMPRIISDKRKIIIMNSEL